MNLISQFAMSKGAVRSAKGAAGTIAGNCFAPHSVLRELLWSPPGSKGMPHATNQQSSQDRFRR